VVKPKLSGKGGYIEPSMTMLLVFLTLLLTVALAIGIRESRITKVKETDEIMKSWIGYHQSELIASWGPPEKITIDGKGGSVLDYSYHKDLGSTAYKDPWGNVHIRPRGYKATRYFYVNSDGIIYKVKWQGL